MIFKNQTAATQSQLIKFFSLLVSHGKQPTMKQPGDPKKFQSYINFLAFTVSLSLIIQPLLKICQYRRIFTCEGQNPGPVEVKRWGASDSDGEFGTNKVNSFIRRRQRNRSSDWDSGKQTSPRKQPKLRISIKSTHNSHCLYVSP